MLYICYVNNDKQTHNDMTNFIHSTFSCNLYDHNSTRSSMMIENACLDECADYSGISIKTLDHCAQKMVKRYNRTNEPQSRDFIANGYKVTLHVG